MSHEKFDPDCPGCRPAIIDVKTGRPVPDSDPIMIAINRAYDESPIEERQAFHNVTCHNSRDQAEMVLVKNLIDRFRKATTQ